jgi:hypothetical protein
MKIRRLLSAVAASAVAASAVAVSASAVLTTATPSTFALEATTARWMMKLYVPSEGIDYGVDLTDIGSVVFTVKVTDADVDYFEGEFGGAIVMSCGPTSITPEDHNWVQKDFWGVDDEALEINTYGDGKTLQSEKVGDYTYSVTCPVDDSNCFYSELLESEDGYAQISFEDWSQGMAEFTMVSLNVLDKNGNSMIAFDGDGNVIEATASSAATDDTASSDTTATTTTTSADKGSPDTGVEGIAAVAGVAVVAAGAVVLSKKRK